MNPTTDEKKQLKAMPARASRKALHTHRSPSFDDLQPGLVFSLPFGSLRSQSPAASAASCVFSDACVPPADVLCRDKVPRVDESHPAIHPTPDGDASDKHPGPFHRCSSSSETASQFSTVPSKSSFSGSSSRTSSLADQYLDTMTPDDFWRALCRRRIRQNQRKLCDLKRAKSTSNASLGPNPIQTRTKYKSKHYVKRLPRTPGISRKFSRKSASPIGSDSGFISSSPPPATASYLRVRSTRNCPVQNLIPTLPIDTSISMIGRSCLSCKCTNTTCWRRTLGGIICNSCGLRYKKCGIICADVKCRYIPTRSELRELRSRGIKDGGQCYTCQGDVIFQN